MNILTSYKWLKEYLDTDLSPEEFAMEITQSAFSVERIHHIKELYDRVVVGQIKEITKHPNADKLSLAKVDIGQSEPLNLIFGSMVEMQVGLKIPVAVAPYTLPDGRLIQKTKIRGEESAGMLCLDQELGFLKNGVSIRFFDEHVPNGTPLAEAMDMEDDVIFDIEVTTNRPDAMSIVGLAREGAAVTGAEFDWKKPELPGGREGKDLTVKVDEQDLCSRYMAVVIDGVKVGPSPMWLQSRLLLAGHRPINNIVDITNYVLYEYGQPLHAFDYEKLAGNTIVVRRAQEGEKIVALDDNEYKLSKKDLVIADSQKPVAIAGVMGGKESGTWEGTTTIVFEAATFDPVSVRKTGRGLNLFSDSQLLFEKGLSTEAPPAAFAKAIELTLEIAGGEVVSEIKDVRKGEYKPLEFTLKPKKVRDLMGVELEENKMVEILQTLGFAVKKNGESYAVTVPYWRDHDIENDVDLTEEIARIYGYHNIESSLPLSPQPNYTGDDDLVWESETRRFLAACGYTELYGYSFISDSDFKRYDLNSADAIKVFNPLSADLTHMRTSLMPSLLKDIEMNQGETPSAKIFELARVYIPHEGDLPEERTNLVFGQFGVKEIQKAFLNTKGVLTAWAEKVGLELRFERLEDDKYWHPSRSALIIHGGKEVGVIGQVSTHYQNSFDIDRPVVLAYIDFASLVAEMKTAHRYEPIPEFPAITRDIAAVIDEKVEFLDIEKLILSQSDLIESVDVVEVYKGAGIGENKKSVTLSIVLRAKDRTLESGQAEGVIADIIRVLQDHFSAIIR